MKSLDLISIACKKAIRKATSSFYRVGHIAEPSTFLSKYSIFENLKAGKCVKILGLLCINLNEKVVNVGFYVPVIRLLSASQL